MSFSYIYVFHEKKKARRKKTYRKGESSIILIKRPPRKSHLEKCQMFQSALARSFSLPYVKKLQNKPTHHLFRSPLSQGIRSFSRISISPLGVLHGFLPAGSGQKDGFGSRNPVYLPQYSQSVFVSKHQDLRPKNHIAHMRTPKIMR